MSISNKAVPLIKSHSDCPLSMAACLKVLKNCNNVCIFYVLEFNVCSAYQNQGTTPGQACKIDKHLSPT